MHVITPLTVSIHPTPPTPARTVPPRRIKNSAVRSREYLTPNEVARLMEAAGTIGRHRLRDRTLVLLAYWHALRVAELVSLRWSQVDLEERRLHVHRIKHGPPSVNPQRVSEHIFYLY
jgi:type 1 fimbriae regulatory protein FimB